MAGFTDPTVLALLGASAGFLDPRGGMMGGFQGAMQGLQAGQDLQDRDLMRKRMNDEAMQRIQAQEFLQKHQQQGTNPRDLLKIGAMSGNPYIQQAIAPLAKLMPKVKTTEKVMKDGNAFTRPVFDDGTFGEVSDMPVASQMSFQNLGDKTIGVNPYTGQPLAQFAQGITPGQNASLAQSARHHADSMGMQAQNIGLAQQRLAMDRRGMVQPKFQDGAFVYPPTEDNPEGRIVKTDMYVPPKGSAAAQQSSAGKVNGLLDEAEKYIGGATGSMVGNVADKAAGALGVSLPGAQNIARLKTLEAGLVMGMPRLEGPQSNLDQQLYREAAGNIGDPSVPAATKKAAIDTIRRIQNTYPGAFGRNANSSSADGWGELR